MHEIKVAPITLALVQSENFSLAELAARKVVELAILLRARVQAKPAFTGLSAMHASTGYAFLQSVASSPQLIQLSLRPKVCKS